MVVALPCRGSTPFLFLLLILQLPPLPWVRRCHAHQHHRDTRTLKDCLARMNCQLVLTDYCMATVPDGRAALWSVGILRVVSTTLAHQVTSSRITAWLLLHERTGRAVHERSWGISARTRRDQAPQPVWSRCCGTCPRALRTSGAAFSDLQVVRAVKIPALVHATTGDHPRWLRVTT